MIAVTGCNGLVGGYIYNFLRQQMVNESVLGLSTTSKMNFIKLVDGTPNIDTQDIKTIIHCGGTVGSSFSKEEHEYANIQCTNNLLKWAEKKHVKHFIYFSTGGVYGQNKNWVDENQTLNPENFYSESKIIAEKLILESYIEKKTIIRLYFPIGNTKNNLFYKLKEKVLNSEVIELNINGQPFISPISCRDIANVVYKIINREIEGVYNLSSNQKININEIVFYIATSLNLEPILNYNKCNLENYLGNANKILKILDVEKFTDLQKDIYDFSRDYNRGILK